MYTPLPSYLAWSAARAALDYPQTRVLPEPDAQEPAPRHEPIVVWYEGRPEPFVAMLREGVEWVRGGYDLRVVAYRWPGYHTAHDVGEPARWMRPPVLVWGHATCASIEFPAPESRVPLYAPCTL